MKNTIILTRSIGPVDITKRAKASGVSLSSDGGMAFALFAYYKLENFLCLFSPSGSPFSIADSADSEGHNFCNKKEAIRNAFEHYHEPDLIKGVFAIAASKKQDERVRRFGLINPIVAVGRIITEYKSESVPVVFNHLRWKHVGESTDATVPVEVMFGFSVGDRPYDLYFSDKFDSFIIRDRNDDVVTNGKLTGIGEKSTVAQAIAKLCEERGAEEIKIEDVL